MNNREWLYSLDVADLAEWFDAEHVDETNGIDGETNGIRAGAPLVGEPPESDAIAHARWRWQYRPEDGDEVVMNEYNCNLLMSDLDAIADMVERDYVSCEKYDEAMRLKLIDIGVHRARCNELEAERDELKSRHCPHYHVDKHYCDVHETRINQLIAERDEWKAKAEHVDATCDNSGGFVTDDSREKLEAEIRYEYNGSIENEAEQILGWLDRQAAITERHWIEIVGASANANIELKRQIDELQAKVDELTAQLRESNAERERLRGCLGIATDHAHDFLTLVDESGNVYDYDEGLA